MEHQNQLEQRSIGERIQTLCLMHAEPHNLNDVPVGKMFFHMSYNGIWVRVSAKFPTAMLVHRFEDDTSGLAIGMHLLLDEMINGPVCLVEADFFAGDACIYRTWNTQT